MLVSATTASRIATTPAIRTIRGTLASFRHAHRVFCRQRRRRGRKRLGFLDMGCVGARGAQYRNLSAVNHLLVRLAGLTHWLFSCGHFRISINQGGTMSDVTIPAGKIRAFVERIENLDTEIQELNEQKKEVFADAKDDGFDVNLLERNL